MNRFIEKYDPSKPVCDNQDDFNMALREAIKYNLKQDMNQMSTTAGLVLMAMWLLFFVWAVVLAMRVQGREQKIAHIFFAILASPIYVLSYYLSGINA